MEFKILYATRLAELVEDLIAADRILSRKMISVNPTLEGKLSIVFARQPAHHHVQRLDALLIRARRQLEDALRQNGLDFGKAPQWNRPGLLICDHQALPIAFNSSYAAFAKRALGIEMQPGMNHHDLIADADLVVWWRSLDQRALAGESFQALYCCALSNGEARQFELSYHSIIQEGVVKGFSVVTRDVTESQWAWEVTPSQPRHRSDIATDYALELRRMNAQLQTLLTRLFALPEDEYRYVTREVDVETDQLLSTIQLAHDWNALVWGTTLRSSYAKLQELMQALVMRTRLPVPSHDLHDDSGNGRSRSG